MLGLIVSVPPWFQLSFAEHTAKTTIRRSECSCDRQYHRRRDRQWGGQQHGRCGRTCPR